MENEFINYRPFESVESAEETLGTLLTQADIPYQIVTPKRDNDLMWVKGEALMSIWLQLQAADFTKVNQLLEKGAYQTVTADSAHFLYSFTNEELMEVVYKADEWSAEDYVMARKLLEQRGKKITEESLASLRAKRLAELQKPQKGEDWLLIMGFGFALAGGLFGVMIGWSFLTATKLDPDGQLFYVYDKTTRDRGRNMMLLGIVMLAVSFTLIAIRVFYMI